jgi:hypothetical protein
MERTDAACTLARERPCFQDCGHRNPFPRADLRGIDAERYRSHRANACPITPVGFAPLPVAGELIAHEPNLDALQRRTPYPPAFRASWRYRYRLDPGIVYRGLRQWSTHPGEKRVEIRSPPPTRKRNETRNRVISPTLAAPPICVSEFFAAAPADPAAPRESEWSAGRPCLVARLIRMLNRRGRFTDNAVAIQKDASAGQSIAACDDNAFVRDGRLPAAARDRVGRRVGDAPINRHLGLWNVC